MLHAFYVAELFDELLKARGVFYVDCEVAAEEAVVAVDVDAAHHDFLLFRYYARYVVHDADVVVADDFQRY